MAWLGLCQQPAVHRPPHRLTHQCQLAAAVRAPAAARGPQRPAAVLPCAACPRRCRAPVGIRRAPAVPGIRWAAPGARLWAPGVRAPCAATGEGPGAWWHSAACPQAHSVLTWWLPRPALPRAPCLAGPRAGVSACPGMQAALHQVCLPAPPTPGEPGLLTPGGA